MHIIKILPPLRKASYACVLTPRSAACWLRPLAVLRSALPGPRQFTNEGCGCELNDHCGSCGCCRKPNRLTGLLRRLCEIASA